MIDLTQVPNEDLTREYMRRLHARRDTSKFTGRPKKLKPCPSCGRELSARAMRAHEPHCKTLHYQDALGAAHKLMDIVRTGRQWSLTTASGCLPPGWGVSTLAQDADFHPCTVRGFTAAFRAYARPTKGDAQ